MSGDLKNILLSSAIKYKNVYNALSRVISTEFTEIDCSIEVKDYNEQGMGLGLRTLQPIIKNKELLTIPVSMGLNGLDLIDFKEDIRKKIIHEFCWKTAKKLFPNKEQKHIQEKNFQNLMLMWQILLNSLYKQSANYEFVESLPQKDLTQPIYTSQSLFDTITSPNTKLFYFQSRSYLQSIYEDIKKEAIFEIGFVEFLWAYNNVLSRKIIINDEDTQLPYQIMLPIFDLINHSSTLANVEVNPFFDSTDNQSFVSLMATRNIEAGEQLFFHYGKMSNKKFLNTFGFFDEENPIKENDVFLNSELIDFVIPGFKNGEQIILFNNQMNDLTKFKQNLFEKNDININNYYPNLNMKLFDNKIDNKLMKFLRIAFLDNNECDSKKEEINSFDFSKMFNAKNEFKVIKFISYVLKIYYSFIKDVDFKSKIENLGVIDNIEKFKEKNLILLQNEEKNLFEKNIHFLAKKMNHLI